MYMHVDTEMLALLITEAGSGSTTVMILYGAYQIAGERVVYVFRRKKATSQDTIDNLENTLYWRGQSEGHVGGEDPPGLDTEIDSNRQSCGHRTIQTRSSIFDVVTPYGQFRRESCWEKRLGLELGKKRQNGFHFRFGSLLYCKSFICFTLEYLAF